MGGGGSRCPGTSTCDYRGQSIHATRHKAQTVGDDKGGTQSPGQAPAGPSISFSPNRLLVRKPLASHGTIV